VRYAELLSAARTFTKRRARVSGFLTEIKLCTCSRFSDGRKTFQAAAARLFFFKSAAKSSGSV
jgi:hypothetical protein